MTVRMTEQGLIEAIEIAIWTGSAVGLLLIGLIVWLIVRPPRRVREERARRDDPEALDAGEMMLLLERMERRLETLERAVEQAPGPEGKRLETTAEGGETRRKR